MKFYQHLKLAILAVLCFLWPNVFAQIQVGDFASFDAAFQSMKTSGGGTIELTANITFQLAKDQIYSLASDAENPIQINTGSYSLISSGTGTTADNAVLEVGDNVSIYGTSTVLLATSRGIVRVAGGSVKTTATSGTNPAAVKADQGWVYVTGGKITVEVATSTLAFGVWSGNYMSIVITGGTIEAIGDGTRAVRISDGNATISGVTVTANGIGAYGLLSLGTNTMVIGNNTTVTTTSTDGSDAGIVSGGPSSRIYIPADAANVNITSSHKYKLDNADAEVLDFRGVNLTANPPSGTEFVDPGEVTLTAAGNESMALARIYYNYDASPTTSSSYIANGGTVPVFSAITTIKASIGKPDATYNNTVYTFTYTVQNPGGPIMVGSFNDLKNAYTASQEGEEKTTDIKLTANITIDADFTMTPNLTHPVNIDANGYYLQVGNNTSSNTVTFGGSLSISTTSNVGIIKINGKTITNIIGGNYTVNGNAPVVFANAGSGVNVDATKLIMSDATFTATGTTNGVSIVKFATSDGNTISATNCIFTISAKGIAFNCVGPQYINIKNCTLTFGGDDISSTAFSQAPTNAVNRSDLTIDGLTLNMNKGNVFSWGGNKNINTVIKDMTVNGSATVAKPTGGTGTTRKFYDFRAFASTANPGEGSYTDIQYVELSLTATGIDPVDAAGASIVYTVDDSEPTASSTSYATPIPISVTTTLKVAAVKDNFVGKSASFDYEIISTGNKELSNSSLFVYPNVVKDILTVNQSVLQIQVYNIAGKIVAEKTNSNIISLSNVDSGVYFVKIETDNSKIEVFKIIKK